MNKMNLATLGVIILVILGLVWIICFDNIDNSSHEIINKEREIINYDEIKGIWLSYLDLSAMLKGKNENEFRKNISQAIDNVESMGLNTLIVHVRPFSDALYQSKYYPWSIYCSGIEGNAPGYDPLQVIIEEAHLRNIRVEAWINPYRVRSDSVKLPLSLENPASKWIKDGSDNIIKCNGGIYYNPAKEEVRQLIVNGVKEIVENYEVDGIHFDDYFYPSSDVSIDSKAYGEYTSSGGDLDLESWRRENVNILVRQVYSIVKEISPEVVFGISPQGSMDNNYNSQFIDVKKWIQNPGYIDYICPQIYYGFLNDNSNFQQVIEEFDSLVDESTVNLYIGLSVYKVGSEDTWAGNGKDEWRNSTDILKRQVEASRKLKKYKGILLFRYDSLFNPSSNVKSQIQQERSNLKSLFK
ncbi:glycoside hydrolase family 10 protein [Clostridium sp. UBA3061]|uniref:glycoside hydrolase family 10 protein n=1 Tax=Clostridium sp. UBA3061 TaxID=1946353 RepID=UPI0032180947